MRKSLLVLVLSALLVAFSAGSVLAGIVVKGGPDIAGKIKATLSSPGIPDVSAEEDVKMGITVGGEYIVDSGNDLVYGAGFEYQLTRQIDNGNEFKFNYIPIYALGRYNFDSFYLAGKVGYNLFKIEDLTDDVTTSGGLYFGIGGGMDFDTFQVEILYSINNGALKPKDSSEPGELKYQYSKISLSVGYKL